MNCPVCGRLEYDCECEPSEPIPEIGGEDDTEDALREHQEEQRKAMGQIDPESWGEQCAAERYDAMALHIKAEQAKKDAGDERLLCAIFFDETVYEKGEPN